MPFIPGTQCTYKVHGIGYLHFTSNQSNALSGHEWDIIITRFTRFNYGWQYRSSVRSTTKVPELYFRETVSVA